MDNSTFKVYIKTDTDGYITAVNSSVFLANPSDWTQIDEGTGDKYAHAQGNYFDKPLMDKNGCYNYKLTDGKPVETTAEDKQDQIDARPAPQPSDNEKQMAAMALTQAQQSNTIIELQQANAALMLKLAGGNS